MQAQRLNVAPDAPEVEGLMQELTHWLGAPEVVPLTLLTTHAAFLWLAPLPYAEECPVSLYSTASCTSIAPAT